MSERDYTLRSVTSPAFGALVEGDAPVVVLLPVGSVEPHGPHMTLLADTVISAAAAERAAPLLEEAGYAPVIAPAVPYGVTECAEGFHGAVSIPAAALTAYLAAVVDAFLEAGAAHVCVVNNHLEPDHDAAVRAAVEGRAASVACPLTRAHARTLTAEFKSGACHAGQYETSIVLAADPAGVDEHIRRALPEVPISLSDNLRAGVTTFAAMGMTAAYAGNPAAATPTEGDETLDLLATMILAEVRAVLPSDL